MSSKKAEAKPAKKAFFLRRLWNWWCKPSRMALGSLLTIGIVAGIVGLVGFKGTMDHFSTNEFCVSCHEMEDNVYQEYMLTTHYSNSMGIQATCADCHIPKEFVPMMVRKTMAIKELYGHYVTGIIDTPTQFEEHRKSMAMSEWARMKANDSQECRNCHIFEQMDLMEQRTVAAKFHATVERDNKTCIDCHKGIAHNLPDVTDIDMGYF